MRFLLAAPEKFENALRQEEDSAADANVRDLTAPDETGHRPRIRKTEEDRHLALVENRREWRREVRPHRLRGSERAPGDIDEYRASGHTDPPSPELRSGVPPTSTPLSRFFRSTLGSLVVAHTS